MYKYSLSLSLSLSLSIYISLSLSFVYLILVNHLPPYHNIIISFEPLIYILIYFQFSVSFFGFQCFSETEILVLKI
ncbi:MAG: hypothetical protein KTM48_03690 [Wolbachia endosymbiont of Pissodes strobi]|nr:hypothetical protein [Wolbachia endosymbiont of Pissodes strobi]